MPLLVAAFSVGRPVALQQPRLPPSFDRTTAVQFARVLAGRAPERTPGTVDSREAADYVATQLQSYRFTVERQPFTADVPGRGRERFENIIAVAPSRPQDTAARSNETIVVMAHRDNLGESPGANDNGSGTAALLELARNIGTAAVAHTIVFVSTDGGAYGGLGAEHFARNSDYAGRTIAVINLDAIAGRGPPRIEFAGDTSRSPASPLIATAEASILAQTQRAPKRPGAGAQLIDLAFPFTLYEQGPFIARGTPAVTITTAGVRPDPSAGDAAASLDAASLDELGRSAQALLGSLDAAAEVTRGTESYIYVGSRLVRGWTSSSSCSRCSCRFWRRPSISSRAAAVGTSRSAPRCGASPAAWACGRGWARCSPSSRSPVSCRTARRARLHSTRRLPATGPCSS